MFSRNRVRFCCYPTSGQLLAIVPTLQARDARFPPVNNVLGNYSGRILRQACGYTPATMVRASRAVWRYRWEIAPFLLAGAAQAVPYWFIALLHNFGLLSSARWATGRSGWQAAYPGDAVWFLSGIVGFALLFVVLRHGIRRLEALGRPVTKALWEALLLALGVWLLAYAAWHALTVFLGLGVWWNVYPVVLLPCSSFDRGDRGVGGTHTLEQGGSNRAFHSHRRHHRRRLRCS